MKKSKINNFSCFPFLLKKMKKRGVMQDYLIWILIAVFVLALLVATVVLFREKGFSVIEQIKNLFRFR